VGTLRAISPTPPLRAAVEVSDDEPGISLRLVPLDAIRLDLLENGLTEAEALREASRIDRLVNREARQLLTERLRAEYVAARPQRLSEARTDH